MSRLTVSAGFAICCAASAALAQITGPSTGQTPYVIPVAPGVQTVSIASNGDSSATYNGSPVLDETYPKVGGGTYRLAGIPDGLGAYDNGDNTFTLLANHELGATNGVVRDHGTIGSFVSKWTINKSNLAVIGAEDLIKTVANVPGGAAPFGRFCSADLPAQSAFFNPASGLGTQEKIFMKGEEVGAEGRGYGTVVSTGTSYYLPKLGKFSWENALANPFAQDKTIVISTDDSTPGEVYMYVGTKTNAGNEVDRAGLTNGTLYGLKTPVATETTAAPGNGAATFVDVSNFTTGAELQTLSTNTQVTKFARPEDGVWNPANPREFYWVNTGTGSAPTRLYRLTLNDLAQPQLGGQVDLLFSGSGSGVPEAMDNMTLVNGRDGKTRLLIQEDGGSGTDDVWMYTVEENALLKVATHDAGYSFANGSESSGIIPAWDLLGDGWYLLDTQAAYSISANGLVAGGQLMAMYVPQSVPEPTVLGVLALAAVAGLRRRRA